MHTALLMSAILLALSSSAIGNPWKFEVVDSGLGLSAFVSLKVAPVDQVHIAYYSATQGVLKYSFFDDSTWTTEVVDGQTTGLYCSLVLSSIDHPRIAYTYYEGHSIRYAEQGNGGVWAFFDFETDPDEETYISIALDRTDKPHISYYDGSSFGGAHDLKYSHHTGTQWATVLVDANGQVGRGGSIALDSRDRPHISYYDETTTQLKHAHFDGVTWKVTTLDDVEFIGFGSRTAIAVDSSNKIHIVYSAYHDQNGSWSGQLRYALFNGTQWTVSTLDEALPHRDFRAPAIAIDSADRPHVSYVLYYNVEPITGDLKYAWLDGRNWRIEFVDTGDISPYDYNTSINVDSRDRPHIAYLRDQSSLIHAVMPSAHDQLLWKPPPGETSRPFTGRERRRSLDHRLRSYAAAGGQPASSIMVLFKGF